MLGLILLCLVKERHRLVWQLAVELLVAAQILVGMLTLTCLQ
jgi:hypothetical protein